MRVAGPTNPGAAHLGKDPLATAAREFESLLTQRLVSTLRAQSDGKEGPGGGMLDLMMNQALAGHLSKGRGMGIASVLYRDWTGEALPDSSTRLAGGSPGLTSSAGAAAHPAAVPGPATAPFEGNGVDDGVTPLRLMLPPTGLEGAQSTLTPATQPDGAMNEDSTKIPLNEGAMGPDHQPNEPSHPSASVDATVRGVDDGHPTSDHTGPAGGRHPAEAGVRGILSRGLGEYRRSEQQSGRGPGASA